MSEQLKRLTENMVQVFHAGERAASNWGGVIADISQVPKNPKVGVLYYVDKDLANGLKFTGKVSDYFGQCNDDEFYADWYLDLPEEFIEPPEYEGYSGSVALYSAMGAYVATLMYKAQTAPGQLLLSELGATSMDDVVTFYFGKYDAETQSFPSFVTDFVAGDLVFWNGKSWARYVSADTLKVMQETQDKAVSDLTMEVVKLMGAYTVTSGTETVVELEDFADKILLTHTDGTTHTPSKLPSARCSGGVYLAINSADGITNEDYVLIEIPLYVKTAGEYRVEYVEAGGVGASYLYKDKLAAANQIAMESVSTDEETMEKNGATIYSYFESSWAKAVTKHGTVTLGSGIQRLYLRANKRPQVGDVAAYFDYIKIWKG